MATYTVYANEEGVVIDSYSRDKNFPVGQTATRRVGDTYLLMSMPLPPQQYRTKAIRTTALYVQANSPESGNTPVAALYTAHSDKDMAQRTFSDTELRFHTHLYAVEEGSRLCKTFEDADSVRNTSGFAIELLGGHTIYTQKSSYKPYTVYDFYDYEAGVKISRYGRAPVRKFVDRHAPILFTWELETEDSIDALTVASAVFLWREGTSGTVHEVSAGTASTSFSLPADTLPASSDIRWNVRLTTANGVTKTGEWTDGYDALNTIDVDPSTPVTLSPVGAVVDGSAPVELRWRHVISSGSAQGAAVLQISQDGATWTQLAAITGAAQSYTAAVGTFTAGTWYWRVKTANGDDAWSDWSAPARLISYYAPPAPSLSVVSTAPRFAVSWVASGQQAFEVRLDGETVAAVYGTDSDYTYGGFAADGAHTVAVRVQNAFGLWSEWAEVALTVANVPGDPITLTAAADAENPQALLSWTGNGSDRYLIYRDGALIGKTDGASFIDRFGVGMVSYRVRGVEDDTGYYTMSGTAEVTVTPTDPALYDPAAGFWLPIRLSDSSERAFVESVSQNAAFYHFAGTAKPSVEFGEAIDRSIPLDAVFLTEDVDAQRALEAMLGHVVCLKLPDGFCMIGALTGYSKRHAAFYIRYDLALTETGVEEAEING